MVLLFLDLYGDSRTARCSEAESSGAWRGGGDVRFLMNITIMELTTGKHVHLVGSKSADVYIISINRIVVILGLILGFFFF